MNSITGEPIDGPELSTGGLFGVGGPSNTNDAGFTHETAGGDIWTTGIDYSDTAGARPYKIARGNDLSTNVRTSVADDGELTLPFYGTDVGSTLTIAAGGRITPAVTDFQHIYDNSTPPVVLTSTAKGALDIQTGSAADTDATLTVSNLAGTATFRVDGDGDVTISKNLDVSGVIEIATSQGFLMNGDITVNTAPRDIGQSGTPFNEIFVDDVTATDLYLTGQVYKTLGAAVAVLSLRKINPTYTGFCCNVRRASDSTNLDIGFDLNGLLDKDAFDTFTAATTGFIEIWYDQHNTRGNNFSNTTHAEQPQILFSTVDGIDTPELTWFVGGLFTGLDCVNTAATLGVDAGEWWVSTIFKTVSTDIQFVTASSLGGNYEIHLGSGVTNIRLIPGGVPLDLTTLAWDDGSYRTVTGCVTGGNAFLRYEGFSHPSSVVVAPTTSTTILRIGSRSDGSFPLIGQLNEYIVWGTDPHDFIKEIEADQKKVWIRNQLILQSYTVAGVPAATPGACIYVSDETGGAVLAFADGTNWRRSTDRAVVS
jgi:hypothetical protein